MAQLWGGRFTKETDQLVYKLSKEVWHMLPCLQSRES